MNRTQILNNDTRPKMKPIVADNIPEPMKQVRRWLAWNWQRKNGKWKKVPVGQSNNEASWNDFETIWTLYQSGDCEGIGFALGDGWAGVDLDGCRVDGELSAVAHDVISKLDTYCEESPTGTGVKLICRAALPDGSKTANSEKTVEVYCDGRYFCVTGIKLSGEVEERQGELEDLHAQYIDPPQLGNTALAAMQRIKPKDTEQDGSRRLFAWACRAVEFNLSDEIAIATIREAEKTHPFPKFYGDGDILARIRDAEGKTVRGCAHTEIQLGPDFPRVVKQTVDALAKTDIYQHLGRLTRVVYDPPKCKYAKDNGAPRLGFIPAGMMLETLSNAADFYRFDTKSKQFVQCLPPNDLRTAICQRGDYPGIPPIHGVLSRPILLPDGQIVTTAGYNADTGLLLNIEGEWPTPMSTDEAVALLLDIWCDFPFATESARSGSLSALLTLLTRQVIQGNVPLHVVDGNRSGVGKGLLTDSWTMISEGRRASRYTLGPAEELKKYLTSLAIRGAEYVLFDNLTGRLGGPVIEAAMTTGSISDRILGASEVVDVPLPLTWLATGNDYTCSRDMVRRTLPIQLDTALSSPEERGGFKHSNLMGHVEKHRRSLLIAGLSIVSNYIKAGSPPQEIENFGGFEEWSNSIRGAVVWAGLADPLADRKQLQVLADEAANPRIRQLVEAWNFDRAVTVSQAVALAATGDAFVTLRGFLEGKPDGMSESEYLGKQLRAARGRVVGDRKIDRTAHSTAKWFAIAV